MTDAATKWKGSAHVRQGQPRTQPFAREPFAREAERRRRVVDADHVKAALGKEHSVPAAPASEVDHTPTTVLLENIGNVMHHGRRRVEHAALAPEDLIP